MRPRFVVAYARIRHVMNSHYICSNCSFEDVYLDHLTTKYLTAGFECTECSKTPAAPLSKIAEIIAETVRCQVRREGDDELYIASRYGDGPNGQTLEAVLQELGCDHPWSVHLADELADFDFCWSSKSAGFFDDEGFYFSESVSTNDVEAAWRRFVNIAISGPRYFNDKSRAFLDDIFHTVRSPGHATKPWDETLDKGSLIYRGREFEDLGELRKAMEAPHKLMGAPPSSRAKGLRMNAPGSPIFYGAEEHETVLRELRPAIENWILICGFRPFRPLKILNLTALELAEKEVTRPLSYFDPDAIARLQSLRVLASFPSRLPRPIAPNREETDYRLTQMIANYIENILGYDGIKWRSAQNDEGYNIGLFSRSASIGLSIANTETLSASNKVEHYSEDDGELLGFEIQREINPEKNKLRELGLSLPQMGIDTALIADLCEMAVMQVRKARYKTDDFSVQYNDDDPALRPKPAF